MQGLAARDGTSHPTAHDTFLFLEYRSRSSIRSYVSSSPVVLIKVYDDVQRSSVSDRSLVSTYDSSRNYHFHG